MLNIRNAIRSASGLDKFSMPANGNRLPVNGNKVFRSTVSFLTVDAIRTEIHVHQDNQTLHTDSPNTCNSNTGNTLIWYTIGCPEQPRSADVKQMF
jgi:hypothetical protein